MGPWHYCNSAASCPSWIDGDRQELKEGRSPKDRQGEIVIPMMAQSLSLYNQLGGARLSVCLPIDIRVCVERDNMSKIDGGGCRRRAIRG